MRKCVRLRCLRSRSPSREGCGTEPQRDAETLAAGHLFLAPPSDLDGTRTGNPRLELCDRVSLLYHAAEKLAESRGLDVSLKLDSSSADV